MTNLILEFLLVDVRTDTFAFRYIATMAQDPIKALIRDYAKALDALRRVSSCDGINDMRLIAQINETGMRGFGDDALNTAETHRELLEAVREGI